MDDMFQPYKRSQYWLGEPAALAEYQAEGTRISKRVEALGTAELFSLASDATANDRARYRAAVNLPWHLKQRLLNNLIKRLNDVWWTKLVKFYRPSKSSTILNALRMHLDRPHSQCRHWALQLLSEFGDTDASEQICVLLDSSHRADQLFAISSLAGRGDECSKVKLRNFVKKESAPTSLRVEAAGKLLRLGEASNVTFLRRVASVLWSKSAYHAACHIQHGYDRAEAFRLFLKILRRAEHPAASVTVMHVANLMHQQQIGFEQEGLNIARRWLATEMKNAR